MADPCIDDGTASGARVKRRVAIIIFTVMLHCDVQGDAPKPNAAEAAGGDGNIQDVDFKNLSADEAFQVLGVSACPQAHAQLALLTPCLPVRPSLWLSRCTTR